MEWEVQFKVETKSHVYSPGFKIKITFGHKLRYEIKVTFGEIYFKLRQMNLNVAINNVNVVADELPSQITIYICLAIDIWTLQRRRTSTQFSAIRPKWRASNEIGAKIF